MSLSPAPYMVPSGDKVINEMKLAPIVNVQVRFPTLNEGPSRISTIRGSNISRRLRSAHTHFVTPTQGTATSSRDAYCQDLIQSRPQKLPVRTFKFVDTHESSGKVSEATVAQIKAHIMREYHRERRMNDTSGSNISARVESKSSRIRFRNAPRKQVRDFGGILHRQSLVSGAYRDRGDADDSVYSPDQDRGFHDHFADEDADPKTTEASKGQSFSSTYRCLAGRPLQPQGVANLTLPIPGPRNIANTGCFDPFASSAVPLTGRMPKFIHFWMNRFTTISEPAIYGPGNIQNPQIIHLAVASLADEAATRALAALGGFLMFSFPLGGSTRTGSEELNKLYSEAACQLFEGIRVMNGRLGNVKHALSTASLLAAAILGSCTAFTGDKSQLFAHHNGLVQMIELRGGLDTLPRWLAHQISRTESNLSIMQTSSPKLPMYRCRFRNTNTLISASDICRRDTATKFLDNPQGFVQSHPLKSPFQDQRLEGFLWGDLFHVACDLHGLLWILDLYSREPNKVGTIEREYFEDTYAAVQHSLGSLPYPQAAGVLRSCFFNRQHCWRLAALLFFNMAIRKWLPASSFMTSLVENLTLALRESDLVSVWSPNSEVLLWIITIGTFAAWETPERGWLVVELKCLLKRLDIKSFDDFETSLRSFLYRDSVFRQPLMNIWTEIYQ